MPESIFPQYRKKYKFNRKNSTIELEYQIEKKNILPKGNQE